jgi:ABC-type polysaccharide/polyol phosphate export permease
MMFLMGTFWQGETLPDILKVIAAFMPLTYITDGLRDTMLYLRTGQALTNTIIPLGLAGSSSCLAVCS